MSNFNAYSQYYDLFYQDKNTLGECEYVIEQLSHFAVPGQNLLELGAGSGRHGKVFKELGWIWTGIERSPSMVALAQADGLNAQHGEIENFRLNTQYSAVLSLFHVISYLTENQVLNATFRNAYEHLVPGGLFLFDVWYSPAVYFQHPEYRVRQVENSAVHIQRSATPKIDWNKNLVEVIYDIEVRSKQDGRVEYFKEQHPMRHFSLPELQLLATYAGFTWLHAEEWMTGNQPGEDTWGVCCILKKP